MASSTWNEQLFVTSTPPGESRWKARRLISLYPRSAAGQLQREGAAVGEAVQRAAARIASGFNAIFGLIEKCAGLLPRKEVGDELDLALEELDRAGVAAAQHSLALLETFVRPDPHVVAFHDRARGEQPLQQVGEQVPPGVGGLDQRLQRHAVCIAIDDQPGQQIRLAVDQPCSAPALGIRADDFAKRDRLRQAAEEELLVDGLVLPREQADGDLARRSVERLACEPAALVGEPHHFAATQ